MTLRIEKLKKSSDFKKITSSSLKFYSSGFLLFFMPNYNSSSILKIGFTASKRVGNAVKRNRCKRIMRALAVEILSKNIIMPIQCVMIARSSMLDFTYSRLKDDSILCTKIITRSIGNYSVNVEKTI